MPPPATEIQPALPPGFVLGVTSSAWQIEGAADRDGRGPSIWDTFSRVPGAVTTERRADPTGDRAAGHYDRVEEDVELLRHLGVGAYKFSISWSRVVPEGRGSINRAGLDFYDRLVDRLLNAGISPTAALHHWDLPQALEDDGGWLNRATTDAFAEYAAVVADRLADRVGAWVPIDAPNVQMMYGYVDGFQAPGWQLGFDALSVAHHLLLGHGHAVAALHAAGATQVGCSNHHAPMWPASDDEADVGATKLVDQLWNGLFMEPMLLGRYPVDLAELMTDLCAPGDLATIRQPLDFYGLSYFRPMKVAATAADEDADVPWKLLLPLGHDQTESGWAIVPEALREWLITTRARFRAALPPLVVTECGASYGTEPDASGVVDDTERSAYLAAHLQAVSEAAQRGVDVRGFYAWTFLDGHCWQRGYDERLGLVHVDFDTLERTPKASYDWYASVIAAQTRSVG